METVRRCAGKPWECARAGHRSADCGPAAEL